MRGSISIHGSDQVPHRFWPTMLGLLIFIQSGLGSAALSLPDNEWPASIKYLDSPCGTSEAHTLFLRDPMGCNPTLAGPGLENQSWSAVCEGGSTTWTTDWFAGLTCSVYDRTEFAPTPSACDLNLKGEYEREFCVASTLPDEVDPFGGGAGLYGVIGSLHSDSGCSDPGFFMYLFRVTDVCISETTESYVWREQNGALYVDNYSTTDCSGAPTTAGPIEVGSCNPLGPTAWASLIAVPEPEPTTQLLAALLTVLSLSRGRMRSIGA
jgi:hypothetical protein